MPVVPKLGSPFELRDAPAALLNQLLDCILGVHVNHNQGTQGHPLKHRQIGSN